ncbi:MAG TPA: zinc ribbon domain-containing protein [Desulfomonilaceae bacterium]|nr:zinc ribbon domain-containing protein [Desulfomonilaceae bacterium]
MSDAAQGTRGKIPLSRFLDDFKSSRLTDQELRVKYALSARSFVNLIKALLAKNIITQDDLARRKAQTVQRDLAKESQFLSGLFICPNCSHPHPDRFVQCPACGFKVEAIAPSKRSRDPLSTTGNHFYVDDDDEAEETVAATPAHLEEMPANTEQEDTKSEKPSSMDQIRSFLSRLKKK